MNYIYDIVLNFNKELYEFFEWKDDDNLINIRKIPLIKINDDDFVSLLYNKIKIEKLVLDTFKKSFRYILKKLMEMLYALLLTAKELWE